MGPQRVPFPGFPSLPSDAYNLARSISDAIPCHVCLACFGIAGASVHVDVSRHPGLTRWEVQLPMSMHDAVSTR